MAQLVDRLLDAYNSGLAAGRNGREACDNPHLPHCDECSFDEESQWAWHEGWIDGTAERKP